MRKGINKKLLYNNKVIKKNKIIIVLNNQIKLILKEAGNLQEIN